MLSLAFYVFSKTYFLLALIEVEETCCSKLTFESIKIPSKVSFVLVLIEASPRDTSVGVLELKIK